MKKCLIIAALFLTASPLSASASFYDGNYLIRAFDARKQGLEIGTATALSYIAGVKDADAHSSICTPEGATLGQLAAIVEQYLREYPSMWHMPADMMVKLALKKAFPCH